MSNFASSAILPAVQTDCVRAQSFTSPPAAACFYRRRAIVQLVGHLDDVMGWMLRTRRPRGADKRRGLKASQHLDIKVRTSRGEL